MIRVEHIDVYGVEAALRGMRNPYNSWGRSDTVECYANSDCTGICQNNLCRHCIGENDLNLMKQLYNGGTEHRKYARFIDVTMDITAPLYWWKEFDTYKVGTVSNSCSTMHKIHAKEFTLDDFSHDHLKPTSIQALENIIADMNDAREDYIYTKDKEDWWQMIQLLPSSYNQKRTIQMNYEVVFAIIRQRRYHRLDEWQEFVRILLELPYVKEIIREEN